MIRKIILIFCFSFISLFSQDEELINLVQQSWNFFELGIQDKAILYSDSAVSLSRKVFVDQKQNIITYLREAADLRIACYQFVESEELLLEAKEIAVKIYKTDSKTLQDINYNLANCEYRLNDLITAKTHLNSAIYYSKEDSLSSDYAYLMGRIEYGLGNYEKAEIQFNKALKFYSPRSNKYGPNIGIINKCLAEIYFHIGEFQKAKVLVDDILKTIDPMMNPYELYQKSILKLKIESCLSPDINLVSRILEFKDKIKTTYGDDRSQYIDILVLLASTYDKLGDANNAYLYWVTAVEKIRVIISNYIKYFSEQQRVSYLNKFNEYLQDFKGYVARHSDNQSLLKLLYKTILTTKAIIYDLSRNIYSNSLSSKDKSVQSAIDNLNNIRNLISGSISKTYTPERKKRLEQQKSDADSIEKWLIIKTGYKNQSENLIDPDFSNVRRRLKVDEAVIEIVRYESRSNPERIQKPKYLALILTPKSNDIKVVNFDDNLESIYLKEYLENISNMQSPGLRANETQINNFQKKLFKVLWEPYEKHLAGIRNIYLSLDGVFNKINLNTLQFEDGSYILDKYQITLIPSSRDLLLDQKIFNDNNKTASLFGDIKYQLEESDFVKPGYVINTSQSRGLISYFAQDSTLRHGFNSLPYTKTEIDNIKILLDQNEWNSKTFEQDEATETNLKQQSPRLLHIATHGKFNTIENDGMESYNESDQDIKANPMLNSYLAFAGAHNTINKEKLAQAKDDGLLTAYEVLNLNLQNTELVVLSACETGLGKIKNGEGVYGLQRAFMVAGARNIIMSLWQVDDKATQELMTTFYDFWLDKGKSIKDSFREAQIEIKKKYKSFYFWGSFVLIGR